MPGACVVRSCSNRVFGATNWRLFVLLLTLAASTRAQHYNFQVFGRESGLANLEVQCLYQDHTGFLWVGTENGLYRYEGSRFRHFGKEEGLPSDAVEAVHQTGDGTVWAATRTGMARFNGSRFERVVLAGEYQM